MSTEADKFRDSFADQLASFDDRLQAKADDVDMLSDIQEGIGRLLEQTGGNEAQIRRVLHELYDGGSLRKETFQLVKSMLDRYVTEKIPTSPTPARLTPIVEAAGEAPPGDDQFASTTVIPVDVLPVDSADSRVQIGSVLRDRFLLQSEVSGGSMGVVYKALDRRMAEAGTGQPYVAVKVLSPKLAENGQALRALQQEAAKGRCLVHQNIVRFIDLDRDDDLYFIVMEWLEGRTLADILDSNDARAIDREAAFRIVRQIGDALDYAHRCGIVHADVKPGNIMILPNGNAKLFDFGVARVRQKQAEKNFDPGILGAMTPAYSSMQVLTGEEPVASDDVFSLACLLYRLLAGYRVFGPRNAAEASETGMTPQRPQGLSDDQWRTLRKALSFARVTRFPSIREFLDALDEDTEETISFDAPERFRKEKDGSPGKWLAGIFVVLGLTGIAANQLGYLERWLGTGGFVEISSPEPAPAGLEEVAPPAEEPVVELDDTSADADPDPSAPADTTAETPQDAASVPPAEAELQSLPEALSVTPEPEMTQTGPSAPLVDFSKLPAADTEVVFGQDGPAGAPTSIVLREDGEPVVVDFVRTGDLTSALTLRLEEVGFSGNRSPWASGQYAMSNAGLVQFPIGQERARITLRTASDPLREADQQSTLRLREADSANSELATVIVTLEDDDQRLFEANLPANTVAFATGQASISEADPAVQIDIVRFNPDDTPLVVGFVLDDITASEGNDYFAPGTSEISFGPGQRSARLLIPLVQDFEAEGDEAFVVELSGENEMRAIDVFQRIVIMIRDDEPPPL